MCRCRSTVFASIKATFVAAVIRTFFTANCTAQLSTFDTTVTRTVIAAIQTAFETADIKTNSSTIW